MPRKNKRKFFFGKNKSSKSAKLQNQNVASIEQQQQQQHQHESDSDNEEEDEEENKREERKWQKSAVHASISSVANDSALELGGGHSDLNSQLSLAEVTATKMGSTSSSPTTAMKTINTTRWRSEPILSVSEGKEKRRATITLKVIQFIPKTEVIHEDTQKTKYFIDNNVPHCDCDDDDDDNHKSTTIKNDTLIKNENEEFVEQILPSSKLHVERSGGAAIIVGEVPKLDQQKIQKNKEEQEEDNKRVRRHFDDNYRVESPTNIVNSHTQKEEQKNLLIENRNKRRHGMLIQELSESSSSEEVKQFLDAEANALELKSEVTTIPAKIYRVDSPESSNDETNRCMQRSISSSEIVQEICESSSNESVKNEIFASLTKQPSSLVTTHASQNTSMVLEPKKVVTLKIINIKELPTAEEVPTSDIKTPSSPIMKTKPIEKKLNKAEEAIMEALYGNPNLLQIPNTPLDVISEEGSDCSDIERHSKINQVDIGNDDDEDDDEVFLAPSDTKLAESASNSSSKFSRNRRRVLTATPKPPVEQPTMLINTKIIETESNVPESCKTWETKTGDSELQAELVYLPSTSSSATDLSERSGEITDPEDIEDTSEDTETNSLLENISVPSLYSSQATQHDTDNNIRILQQACELYHDSEQQSQLPDISEEEEETSQHSLEIIESQQQIIENVNKELHHFVNEVCDVEKIQDKEEEENKNEEIPCMLEEIVEKSQPRIDSSLIIEEDDKKQIITTTDNEQQQQSKTTPSSSSGTPIQFRRKYSSDSSSSSANSQCTIIRQTAIIDSSCVHPLRDLCMQSLQMGINNENVNNNNGFGIGGSGSNNNNNDNNQSHYNEAKIIVQKKFNSISRNAPNIPIIDELEVQFKNDHHHLGRENQRDKVITILQVPPDIKTQSFDINQVSEKERWYGLPSTQMPNVLLALSPMQKDYMMNSSTSQDSQQTAQSSSSSSPSSTSADVLLDMHKKFIERRAYHENSDDENSGTSRLAKVLKQQREEEEKQSNDSFQSYFENADAEVKKSPSPSSSHPQNDDFEIKKVELEDELKRLAFEQQELEEELKNIQSLHHFKREEFLFNQRKEEKMKRNFEDELQSQHQPMALKNVDENLSIGSGIINSNEKLHQEIYNEWQDKVSERNERKLQKTLKITNISNSHDTRSERAASEKFIPLRDEFIGKVKERQKRLSLPIDDNHNWDGSTESLLNDANDEGKRKKKKSKVHHVEGNKENFPAHFREFLDYCEQEIAQSKNSVESGESMNKSLLYGLIGVASLCIGGFFIWKNSS